MKIFLVGGKSGSGKSEVSKLIKEYYIYKLEECVITSFSKYLKLYATELTDWDGNPATKPREYLQNIGDVVRNIDKRFLTSRLIEDIILYQKYVDNIIISDVRYPAEIDELSLGQKQRITIAGVLAINPEYIVFDEPTTMIDSEGKEAVYKIISTLKENGYTIIYVTNNTEEILLADKILILDKGKIAETINKQELLDKVDILKKYNLKIPAVIKILEKLRENNININVEEMSLDSVIEQVVEVIKNEKCN